MKVLKPQNFFLGNLTPIASLILLIFLLPVVIFAGQKVATLFSHAADIPANIVVDASASQANLSRPWQGLSQGGEQEVPGKLVSLSPVSSQIRQLGVRYIRIDHVLEQPFDTTLKNRVQEILDSGAIPFVSLSYFPTDVSSSNIGQVNNWSSWQQKVKNLIQTVSGRTGMNVAGVYYEVWNEPDGEGFGAFSIGPPAGGKDYFTLYQKTVEAAQSASNTNSFKIGGPALADLRRCTNGLLFICNEYWLQRFLGLVSQNHTRLDFISWHKYATKLSDYEEDVNFITSQYNAYPALPPAEKIITEWGSNPARSPIHNSVSDAAHLVAAARAFIGHVDLATKFEVRDGPDSKNEGWGILYHDGSPKPTFTALTLLNKLRTERVHLSGEGSFVTGVASRDSSGVSLILSNYDASGFHAESVPIQFNKLIPGRYRITKSTLNSSHPLGIDEVSLTSTSDGNLKFQETLLPNSVIFYDLQLIGVF